MKKKVTRLISAVLSVTMTLTAVPVTAFADSEVHTHDGDSNVITKPLDFREMAADDSGNGWSWVNDTKTLTLDGVNIQATTDGKSVVTVPDGTEIVLKGENTIVQTNDGDSNTFVLSAVNEDTVNCDGTMTISGDGVLNVENRSTDSMMYSLGGGIILSGGTVNATGKVLAESLEIHNDGALNANASATSFDGVAVSVSGSITVDGNGSLNAVGCAIEDEDIMNSAILLTGNQDNKISVSGNGCITASESNEARYGICYDVDRKRINAEISGGKVTAYGTLCGISSINLIMSGSGSVYATGGVLGIDNTNPSIDEDEFVIKGSTEFKAEENAVTDEVEYYNNWYRIGEENAKTVVIKPDTSPRIILGNQIGIFKTEEYEIIEDMTDTKLKGTVYFDITLKNMSDEEFADARGYFGGDEPDLSASIIKTDYGWVCMVCDTEYSLTYDTDNTLTIKCGDIVSNTVQVKSNANRFNKVTQGDNTNRTVFYTNTSQEEKDNYKLASTYTVDSESISYNWYSTNSAYSVDELGATVSGSDGEFKLADNIPAGNYVLYCDITYSDGDSTETVTEKFTFTYKECAHENGYSDGKCTDCGALCDHSDINAEDGVCRICGAVASVALYTDGDGNLKYVDTDELHSLLNEYGRSGTVKLFKDYYKIEQHDIDGVITIDLNGHNFTVRGVTPWAGGKVTFKNSGSEQVTCSGSVSPTVDAPGGTLIVDGDIYFDSAININDNGTVILNAGKYVDLTIKGDRTLYDMLGEGKAFFDADGNLFNAKVQAGSDLTVKDHSHTYNSEGECDCGYVCSHSNIDTDTGICKNCKHEFVATLSTDGNAPTGFDSLQTCLDSVTADTENYVKLYQDIEYDTLSIFAVKNKVTLDLNGHRLGKNVGINIEESDDILTLTGAEGSYIYRVFAYNEFIIDSNANVEFGSVSVCAGAQFTVHNGAKVTVSSLNVYQYLDSNTKTYTTSATLAVGMKINYLEYILNTSAENGSVMFKDLLADNQALQYDESGELVDLYEEFTTQTIHNITVVEHSHTFSSETGKCDCGYACEHNDVDIETGICSVCGFGFTASISGVSGVATKYFVNVDTAFSMASKPSFKGGTLAIYKDCELTKIASIAIDSIIIDLGGHTIDVVNENIFIAIMGSTMLTLTGGGKFNGEIKVFDGTALINGVNDTKDSKAVSIKKLYVESANSTTYLELYGGAYDSLIFNGDLADVAIYGGSFGEIKSEEESTITVGTLLAKNRVFVRTLPAELIDGSAVTLYDGLTNVSVVEHEHRYNVETGKCPCGVCVLAVFTETTLSTVTYTFIESATQFKDIAENEADGELKLTSNVDCGVATLTINGNKTIDMNGHTLNISYGTATNAFLSVNGNVTFENSGSDRATINGEGVYSCGMTTVNGNIKFNGFSIVQNGDALINAGVFKSIEVQAGRSVSEILGSAKALASESTGDILNASNNEVNITNDNIIVIDHPKHTYDDHGNCACGYKCLHDGECQVDEDSTNIVCSECGAKIYAKVTTADGKVTYYDDITKAATVAAKNEGSTLTLVSRDQTGKNVTISGGKFTVDLAGVPAKYKFNITGGDVTFMLSEEFSSEYSDRCYIKINGSDAKVTINGKAEFSQVTLSAGKLTINSTDGYISKLSIEGGKSDIDDAQIGKMTFSGGDLTIKNITAGSLNINSGSTDNIVIESGMFNSVNCDENSDNTLGKAIASGSRVIGYDSNVLYTYNDIQNKTKADRIVVEKCDHKDDNGNAVVSNNACLYCNSQIVATVSYTVDGDEKADAFTDIYGAFDKANEVDTATITLQKNIEGALSRVIESKGSDITLDLNGKKLRATYLNYNIIEVKSGKLTVKGGDQSTLDYVTVCDGTDVEIQGGSFTSLTVKDGGNAELKGGKIYSLSVAGEGRTLEDLLAYGYGYKDFIDNIWVSVANSEKQTIANVSVKEAPIKSASIAWYYEESPIVYRNGAKAIQLNATYELADTSKQITYSDFANGNQIRSNYLFGINEIGPYYAVMGTEIGQSVADDGKVEYYTVFKCDGYEYKSNSLQFTLETCPHENLVTENGIVTCDTCGFRLIAQVKTADGKVTNYDDITKAAAAAAENEGSTLTLVSRDQTGKNVTISGGKFTVDLAGVPAKYKFNITGGDITFKSSENFSSKYSDYCDITVDGSDAKVTIDGKIKLERARTLSGTLTINSTDGYIEELSIEGGDTVIKYAYVNTLSMNGTRSGNISIVSGRFDAVTFQEYTIGKAIASGSRVKCVGMYPVLYKYSEIQNMTYDDAIIVEKCDHKDDNGNAAVSNNACLYCNSQIVATVSYTVDGDEKADAFTDIYAAFDKANEAGTATVKLYRDIADSELTRDITVKGDVTLELNGKKLGDSYDGKYIRTSDGGELTVNGDGKIAKTVRANKNSKLTINSGEFDWVIIDEGGDAVICGGSIAAANINGNPELSGGKFYIIAVYGTLESKLADGYAYKIDGGEWLSIADRARSGYSNGDHEYKPLTVEEAPVLSTELEADKAKIYRNGAGSAVFSIITTMRDGNIVDADNMLDIRGYAEGTAFETRISTGTIKEIITPEKDSYLSSFANGSDSVKVYYIVKYNGYELRTNTIALEIATCDHPADKVVSTVNDNLICGECESIICAEITNGDSVTYYDDFVTAIADAQLDENEGCTVKVTGNTSNMNYITLSGGQFTLDLAGRMLNFRTDYGFFFKDGADVTIKDSIGGGSIGSVYNVAKVISVQNGGKVTLEGGTIANNVYVEGGKLDLCGATVNGKVEVDKNAKEVTIRGGSVINGRLNVYAGVDPAHIKLSGGKYALAIIKCSDFAQILEKGKCLLKDGGGYYSYSELCDSTCEPQNFTIVDCDHKDADGNLALDSSYACKYCGAKFVARVRYTADGATVAEYFESIYEAFDKANTIDDSLIDILNNVEGQLDKPLTVTGNITLDHDNNSGIFAVSDDGRSITVADGGILKLTGRDCHIENIFVEYGGQLYVNGGTYGSVTSYGYTKLYAGTFGKLKTDAIGGISALLSGEYSYGYKKVNGEWLTVAEREADSAENVTIDRVPLYGATLSVDTNILYRNSNADPTVKFNITIDSDAFVFDGVIGPIVDSRYVINSNEAQDKKMILKSPYYDDTLKSSEICTLAGDSDFAKVYFIVTFDGYEVKTNTVSINLVDCKHSQVVDPTTDENSGGNIEKTTYCEICKSQFHAKIVNGDSVRYYNDLYEAAADAQKSENEGCTLYPLYDEKEYKEQIVINGGKFTLRQLTRIKFDKPVIIKGDADLTLSGRSLLSNAEDRIAIIVESGNVDFDAITTHGVIVNGGNVTMGGSNIGNLTINGGNVSITSGQFYQVNVTANGKVIADYFAPDFWAQDRQTKEWFDINRLTTVTATSDFYGLEVRRSPMSITQPEDMVYYTNGYYPNGIPSLEVDAMVQYTAEVNPAIAYQWFNVDENGNETEIEDATGEMLSLENLTTGKYYCRLTYSNATTAGVSVKSDIVTATITECEHTGGEADCTNKAVCEICNAEYGDLLPHNYELRKEAQYLKSPADCTNAAVYYLVCTMCGKSSELIDPTVTQVVGDPLGHNYGEWVSNGNGTHTRVCANDSTHTETNDCHGGTATCTAKAKCEDCGAEYGEMTAHNFTSKTADAKYLKTAATCTIKAVYYTSCTGCGLSSKGTADEATFEGEAIGHKYGEWVSNGDGTHTRVCANDSSHTETKDCHGGKATCTAKAICEDCGAEYGEMTAHNFTSKTADAKYLKTAATCTIKAVYYTSCTGCGLSSKGTADEATFEGEAL